MKNDLIDRYIYAVTKRINPKIREDVKNELYGLVDDMLTERCGESAPTEKDIRVVLTELGTPQELYVKYSDDGDKCLIGQPYYSTYKFVMQIVLGAVATGMTVLAIMTAFTELQPWYETVLEWVSLMWSGVLQAFGIVTIIFAVLSHKGIQLGEPYNLDDLPPVPKKKQEVSRGECIFSIVFTVILMVLLLGTPQYLIGYWGPEGVIALFNSEVLRRCWYLVLIFGVADITRSAYRLMEGRYNRRVLTVTLVTNVICAVAVTLWVCNSGLINPEFVSHIQLALAGEEALIRNIFTHFDRFLLAVILLALVLDTIEATIKTFKK